MDTRGYHSIENTTQAGVARDSGEARCLVAMYHYVRPHTLGAIEEIRGLRPDDFRRQLDVLCRTLNPFSWPEFYAWQSGRAELVSDSFLLTFDDGLKDHVRNVLPILEEFGLTGVFFVPGAVLMGSKVLPAHATHLLMSALGAARYVRAAAARLETIQPGSMDLAEGERAVAHRIYHYEPAQLAELKYVLNFLLSSQVQDRLFEEMLEPHIGPIESCFSGLYLSWDDVVSLENRGHTIGAHGFSHHPYLTMSPEARTADIRKAAVTLREGLGPYNRPFSYPFGSVDAPTAEACRSAGFVQGFTTASKWVDDNCNPMQLPRVDTIHVDQTLRELSACR